MRDMVRSYVQARHRAAYVYGSTYYLSRLILITASAIVAAGQNLSGGVGTWLVAWVPVLSVLVASLTALDTWLKPQQKWKGSLETRDAVLDLLLRMDGGLDNGEARQEFREIKDQHRNRNIF
ncbi:DUF4231 domain-containing protein [Streptomyces sp. PA03-5A]|nr:DUF4231 domain-containing protein [Streptomyces sp. PA03-5A]